MIFRADPSCSQSQGIFSKTKPWEWSPFHHATDMMAAAAMRMGFKEEDANKENRILPEVDQTFMHDTLRGAGMEEDLGVWNATFTKIENTGAPAHTRNNKDKTADATETTIKEVKQDFEVNTSEDETDSATEEVQVKQDFEEATLEDEVIGYREPMASTQDIKQEETSEFEDDELQLETSHQMVVDKQDKDYDPSLEDDDSHSSDSSDEDHSPQRQKGWFKKKNKVLKTLNISEQQNSSRKESQANKIKKRRLKKDSKKSSPAQSETTGTTQNAYAKGLMLPLHLKCRLCKEMHHPADMKEHIIKSHGDQQTVIPKKHKDKVVKQKMMGNIDACDAFGDFEVSALTIKMRLCSTCEEYIPEQRIGVHLRNHQKTLVDSICSECGVQFKSYRYTTEHKNYRPSAAIRCKACHSAFRSVADAEKRKTQHKKEKNWQCEICGKAFRKSTYLLSHRPIHMTVKPWQCPDCGKGFARKSNMVTHRRLHSGDKPYVCDVCQEAYTHNVSLKTHKKKIHGIDMWAALVKTTGCDLS
ncbi:uncharacterized protein [Amphiura filiformis]|uniref:uncharacterized protein n=1 Tax=Amphiura filiformis TaxID=82378 RepID=UPI003B21BD0D